MRTWLLTGGVGLLAAGPAGAFYFPGWPADGLPRTPTLFGPLTQTWTPPPGERGEITTLRWPPDLDQPAAGPSGGVSDRPLVPQGVPEPRTLLLAAAGLGVAGWKWRSRSEGERGA